MGTIYLWTILAYLLGLVVVGLKGSRGVASQEDFSVAGRVRELERSSYYYAPRPPKRPGAARGAAQVGLASSALGLPDVNRAAGTRGMEGHHKRIYRIYREEGLQVRRRKRKRAARWRGERLEEP